MAVGSESTRPFWKWASRRLRATDRARLLRLEDGPPPELRVPNPYEVRASGCGRLRQACAPAPHMTAGGPRVPAWVRFEYIPASERGLHSRRHEVRSGDRSIPLLHS